MRYEDLLQAPRPWRRLNTRSTGTCEIFDGPQKVLGTYEQGEITTGRSQIHAGYFIRITDPRGVQWVAEDPHSPLKALHDVNAALFIRGGWILTAIGVDPEFEQPPIKAGTPWGYHPKVKAQSTC